MRWLDRTLRNILGLILILGLTAGAVWLLAGSRPRRPQSFPEGAAGLSSTSSQQSPLPTPTTALRAPDASPTPKIAPPPNASPTPATAPMPYLFGEPRIVLTNTSAIGISGWLPDSRQLLLTIRRANVITETIETLDAVTGERHIFGERASIDRPPVWLPSVAKVAFTRLEDLRGDQWGRVDLWISAADTARAHEPILRGVNWAIGGNVGNAVPLVALTYPQAVLQPLSDQGKRTDAAQVDLRALGLDVEHPLSSLQIAASPTSTTFAVFDQTHFYIVDLEPQRVRKIDLGQEASESRGYGPRHALLARWSPDGQRLALLTTVGEPIYPYTDLTILDVHTGKKLDFPMDNRRMFDFAWAPDGLFLAVIADNMIEPGMAHYKLSLVDAVHGISQTELADAEFMGLRHETIAWAPDGQWLAISCAVLDEDNGLMQQFGRICIFPVDHVLSEDNKHE